MGFLFWSRCAGSNRGPTRYECVALPTELHRLILERDTGIEPVFQPWEGRVLPLN